MKTGKLKCIIHSQALCYVHQLQLSRLEHLLTLKQYRLIHSCGVISLA